MAPDWALGDRVRVLKSTPFTPANELGTVTSINEPGPFPVWVTLDNGEDPFDVLAVAAHEIEALDVTPRNAP